ncbi:(2S)-3-sulfopropanediol dehydratase activating enzyme [Desulfospira joergensenii]|uniref:(2S)-3-sulfopropanediol dehydratase activating enzyme n=1 Tax=Desulfospira joergensenii TaxID=53329 RepID=UPI0003B4F45D|nr:glycyl-radical enzyme activating protein [Desulfospira joergensenii]
MTTLPDRQQKGIVFNIQKYSLHDGEGIRTIIFLKGCSLVCAWCSNPESQQLLPELGYNPAKCLTRDECSRCRDICPEKALSVGEDNKILVDHKACINCLACAEACPANALNIYGYEITVADAIARVEEDAVFYMRSGGGLTLSGGEPLYQGQFAVALLREARKRRINTNIETCGNVSWNVLDQASQYLNSIYYDIKVMDREKHKAATGFDNSLITENLVRLNAKYPQLPVTVRTPVIPGINDNEEEIGAIVDFIKDMPGVTHELLAYHRMGTPKYTYLGRSYPLKETKDLPRKKFAELKAFAEKRMGPALNE